MGETLDRLAEKNWLEYPDWSNLLIFITSLFQFMHKRNM